MNKLFAGKTIHDVVHEYADMLMRIAFQNTKNLTDAEDVVQDIYLKLIKTDKAFASEEHLKAWLIRVTINRCRDLFRMSWFKRTVALTEEMSFVAPEEVKVLEEIFLLDKLDRNIVYLHYYEGYAIHEIADLLGKNKNTIGSRLRRARGKLKTILEEGRES